MVRLVVLFLFISIGWLDSSSSYLITIGFPFCKPFVGFLLIKFSFFLGFLFLKVWLQNHFAKMDTFGSCTFITRGWIYDTAGFFLLHSLTWETFPLFINFFFCDYSRFVSSFLCTRTNILHKL